MKSVDHKKMGQKMNNLQSYYLSGDVYIKTDLQTSDLSDYPLAE